MYEVLATTTWLGAAPDAGGSPAAWGAYLGALRDKIQSSKAEAVSAYNTLKQVRQNLGLPFMGGATGEGNADLGAWTQDYEQQAVDILAMSKICVSAANDAIAGKRKLIWDDQIKDFAIEGFNDALRIQYDANGTPVLVGASGYPEHASGQVGFPPLVFGAIAVGAIVQAVGIYLIVDKALDTIQVVANQKTERTVAEATKKHADLVAQGKETPAEAAAATDAIYKGATGLRKAATEPKAKQTSDIADAVKTVAWVGLGVGVLYVVAQVLKGGMPSLAGARDNPDYTQGRIFYLPASMRDVPPLTPSGTDLEIWTWEDERKSPKTGEKVKTFHGIAFAGKAGKPLWHHWFGTAASRMKMITDSIASRKAHSSRIEEQKQKRRTYQHTLKVGSVLVSHWGYDQTNIDFYEVIQTKEKSVVICKIGSKEVEAKQNLSLVVPVPGKCYGEPMTKRVGEGGYIRLTSYSSASLWDGKPEYETASGWGH